jgi:predicted component of type VI protein secretion system
MKFISKSPAISTRLMLVSGILVAFGVVVFLLIRELVDQEKEIHSASTISALTSSAPISRSAADGKKSDASTLTSPKSGSPHADSGDSPIVLSNADSAATISEEPVQGPPPEPLPTPAVYADPEKLGEVTEFDESMYARALSQFAERMSNVTAPPDSAEYREQFKKASEEAENAMRGLMGSDAFLKMQAAAARGETVK